MSDTVKLVIEIPKESYEYIKTLSDMGWLTSPEYSNATRLTCSEFVNAIKNGTSFDDARAEIEQKAYIDGFEGCAESIEKYLSDEDKKRLECLVSALRNSVAIDWGEESEE